MIRKLTGADIAPKLVIPNKQGTQDIDTLFPLVFSSSMLGDVWGCEFLFYRKYCQRLVGGNKSTDLIAGGYFARACEIVRKAYYNDKIDFHDAVDIGYEYIQGEQETGDPIKTNERLARALKSYFRKFPLTATNITPCQLEDGTYAIEYEFSIDLGIPHPDFPDRSIVFNGKLDMLAEQLFNGQVVNRFVLDEKTAKRVYRIKGTELPDIPKHKQEYMLRGQFLAYHWAAWLLGIETKQTLVRRVPIMSNPEPAFEIPVEVDKYRVKRWMEATLEKIWDLRSKYLLIQKGERPEHRVFYPVYNEHCHAFNRPCPYIAGCLYSEGEEELLSTHRQGVRYPEIVEGSEVSLAEYKMMIKEGKL